MRKIIAIIVINTFLISCSNTENLDLSKIDFNKDSKEYYLDKLSPTRTEIQKGHFEISYDKSENQSGASDSESNVSLILKDNGENVKIYYFDDLKSNSKLNFAGESLDETFGTNIVVYDNKISFISTSIERNNSFKLISFLQKKLNQPTEIISGERAIDEVDTEIINQLIKIFHSDAKKGTNEFGNEVFTFPEVIYWYEKDTLYQLTLNPSEKQITNRLAIISKRALKDKIIMGFHNPAESPILNKYIK